MKTVILASASPWRKELLKRAGVRFKFEVSGHNEDLTQKLKPEELVKKLALEKVRAVALRHQNAIVLGADTVAVFRGKVIGKPRTKREARAILKQLSGKEHSLITGFAILDTKTGKTVVRSEETLVFFRKLTPLEIGNYARGGEPLTVAGGYAIQGGGASFAYRIEGDFYNIVGLPLAAVVAELRKFGHNTG